MSHEHRTSRRRFLRRTAAGAVVLGFGGGIAYVAGRIEPIAPGGNASSSILFRTDASRARKLTVEAAGRIVVAADRSLLVHAEDGAFLESRRLDRPARCIAAAPDGTLLVGFIDHVERHAADGTVLSRWERPEGEPVLGGIAVGAEADAVFVADAGNRCVWRFDRNGRLAGRVNGAGSGFAAPAEFFSLSASRDGRLHVGNPGRHRIETYSAAGDFIAMWGRRSRDLAGFSGCCNPVSFAVLADGRYITAERGQPRIKLYDDRGRFQSLLAGPDEFAENADASASDQATGCSAGGLELALDREDRLLVLDRTTGIVRRLDRMA